MQQCSIRSFLAAGHQYHLYTYGAVSGVPDGAVVLDAEALIPADKILYNDLLQRFGVITPSGDVV